MSQDGVELPALDFCWAGSTRVPAGSSYGPYTTVYWEFIWCMDGAAQVDSGGQRFQFDVGSLQLTPPGVRNYYEWHATTGTMYGYAIFTAPENHVEWPRFRTGQSESVVQPLLDHVLWLDSVRPPDWKASATTALGYAIHAFVAGASGTRLAFDYQLPEVIADSLEEVRKRWAAEGVCQLSLKELAAAAGVTEEYLCRVYSRYLGMGPVSAIRTLRLHWAADLLASTNLSITDIAGHLGFSSAFHFSRSFRHLTGQTPSRFRRYPEPRLNLSVELRQADRYLRLV